MERVHDLVNRAFVEDFSRRRVLAALDHELFSLSLRGVAVLLFEHTRDLAGVEEGVDELEEDFFFDFVVSEQEGGMVHACDCAVHPGFLVVFEELLGTLVFGQHSLLALLVAAHEHGEARAALFAGTSDPDEHDVHAFAHEHAAEAADVFEALFEQHQVHLLRLRVCVVVFEAFKGLHFKAVLSGRWLVEKRRRNGLASAFVFKVILQELIKDDFLLRNEFVEVVFGDFVQNDAEPFEIVFFDKAVGEDSSVFVTPKVDYDVLGQHVHIFVGLE